MQLSAERPGSVLGAPAVRGLQGLAGPTRNFMECAEVQTLGISLHPA